MAEDCPKNNDFEELITSKEVRKVIDRAAGPTTKIIDYFMKPYSEERVGFLGSHLCLRVTVQRSESSKQNETFSFFLKCIPLGTGKEALLVNEARVFVKETVFYRHVVPELLKNFECEQWGPKCYLVKDNLLVFEDLSPRNFKMADATFDAITLQSALASLARFHAASIVAEKRLGISFHEIYPALFTESIFKRDTVFYKWYLAGVDIIMTVIKSLGLDDSGIIDYLDQIFEIVKPSRTRTNIVCHCDLWSNNFMVDAGSPPKCVIVDYQLLRYLPLAADLSQLIYLTTNRSFREESEERVIASYYRVLCETVRRNDADIELPRIEEILEVYEEYRCYGLIIAALYFPAIFMDSNFRTEYLKNSETYDKFFFQSRTDLVMELMDKDPTYREKITEIVNEIVDQSKVSTCSVFKL